MAIKIKGSAQKYRVGRVSGNTGIFFFGLIDIHIILFYGENAENKAKKLLLSCIVRNRYMYEYGDVNVISIVDTTKVPLALPVLSTESIIYMCTIQSHAKKLLSTVL